MHSNQGRGKVTSAMTSSSSTGRTFLPADILLETQALWKQNRLRCGWFLRDDLIPENPDDLARCLRLLARHGDRATFIRARKLQRCL